MRKVVLYELLSLDGVAERPDEFVLDFDPVMQENLGRVVSSQDAVLLGRRIAIIQHDAAAKEDGLGRVLAGLGVVGILIGAL